MVVAETNVTSVAGQLSTPLGHVRVDKVAMTPCVVGLSGIIEQVQVVPDYAELQHPQRIPVHYKSDSAIRLRQQ